MTSDRITPAPRRVVLLGAVVLAAIWFAANWSRIIGGPGGSVSLSLGSLFAALLILRPKPHGEREIHLADRLLAGVGVAGLLAVAIGIVVPIHQLEWLGVLLVLFACLAWGLPARYVRDLILGLFILYWVHPIPSQIFGPLQLAMQQVSVKLSEWLLQAANVRVWGDGLVLRSGLRVFGVPEACSGMKTATTVFFCGLGVALLMRFRWPNVALLLGVGMIQVVALNVVRISGIVWFGADKPATWNDAKVLHDTMGVFMIIGVALIYLDAVLARQWSRWRQRQQVLREINDEVGEWEETLNRWPTFWRLLFMWWAPVAGVVLIGGGSALMILRLNAFHRSEMVRGVAETLMRSDLRTAERAVRAGIALDPGNEALQTALATVLFESRRYDESLAHLRRRPVEARSVADRVLEARALVELKQYDAARDVMDHLPPETRDWPGVAMVMAEFNALLDRPEEVAPWMIKASYGIGLMDRMRRLFPYMASRELWETICKVDPAMPYADPVQGVIAATAHLRINDIDGAADVLRRAMTRPELDRVFLSPLIAVWSEHPDSEWETRLESVLQAHLAEFTAAELSEIVEGAFKVGRPDLAWRAFVRLQAAFPGDPELVIAPAQFGRSWFSYRQQYLGLPAQGAKGTVDARLFLETVGNLGPWRRLWSAIPVADELQSPAGVDDRPRRLHECLSVLQALERQNKLEPRMEPLFAQVLGELGRWDEAHAKLDAFEKRHPANRRAYVLQHAALYRGQGVLEPAYEALAEYLRLDPHAPLAVRMDLANVALALDLGPFAVGLIEDASRVFPESDELTQLWAVMLGYFGLAEEALFRLNHMKVPADAGTRLRCLMATGRIKEGDKLAGVEHLTALQYPRQQTELLMPAEKVLQWQGGTLAESDYERERKALPVRESVYLARVRALKDAWYREFGGGTSSDVPVWESAGRDVNEKALALNELTLLMARRPGGQAQALVVARRAVALRPEWSVLRRIEVALSCGAPDVVERAFKACPWDDDLWLALLLLRSKSPSGVVAAGTLVDEAIASRSRSPGAMVRAGEYLLRNGMVAPAAAAARDAIARGQGLLPAYVLGLACAVKSGNRTWAIQCARDGADQALEPWAFYKVIVALKAKDAKPDADLIRALAGLQAQYPDESVWSERLGDAYFRKGQPDHAMDVLEGSLKRAGSKQPPQVRTYLIAAEAARLEGDITKALRILADARKDYPSDASILNNFVYTLAQNPATVRQASELLPELLKAGGGGFAVYDTAAIVALRSGDLKSASDYAARAVSLVKQGDYAWHEVYLNAAEAQIEGRRYREARKYLDVVRKSADRAPGIEARVRDLIDEIAHRERE